MSLRSRLEIISDEADRETVAAFEDGSGTNIESFSKGSVYDIIQQPLR